MHSTTTNSRFGVRRSTKRNVSARLEGWVVDMLEQVAQRNGVPMSHLVEMAVEGWLERTCGADYRERKRQHQPDLCGDIQVAI